MRVLSGFTGQTSKEDVQIQTSCQKLNVEILGAAITDTQIEAIQLSVFINSTSGQRPLINAIPLLVLLEIGAQNEGLFIQSDTEISGTIDLTRLGALTLKNDEYLSVNIKGLQASWTTNINTIDVPVRSQNYIAYDKQPIQGQKDLNLSEVYAIVMPVASIASITIDYPSKSVVYTANELRYIARDINDIISINPTTGVAKFGFSKQVVFSVENATRCQVVPVDNNVFDMYLLKERGI